MFSVLLFLHSILISGAVCPFVSYTAPQNSLLFRASPLFGSAFFLLDLLSANNKGLCFLIGCVADFKPLVYHCALVFFLLIRFNCVSGPLHFFFLRRERLISPRGLPVILHRPAIEAHLPGLLILAKICLVAVISE